MSPPTDESIHVLHVDDEPDFGELVSQLLERTAVRFELVTVTTPEEGLRALRESDIDCVISDYEMGDWNGLEFLRAVRTTHPTLPFVFFTSRRSEELSRTALSGDATQYLRKGSDAEQYAVLASRISDAVERYRPESERQRCIGRLETAEDSFGQPDQGVEERSPLIEDDRP